MHYYKSMAIQGTKVVSSPEPLLSSEAPASGVSRALLKIEFNDYDVPRFLDAAAHFDANAYAYVVTPNTDHVIRYYDDASFRELYRTAGFVLLDSRFLAYLVRFTSGVMLPTCPGSDVTAQLLANVVAPADKLVLIGGSDAQARFLTERFGLSDLAHFNPPMGFIRDPAAVEECLQFIEKHSPFRFCLLAVGSPQQEVLAQSLLLRGRARGLALCVGASINFLTGTERRAPRWMQRAGIEWLYRLMQDPARMARRYILRGPRIFLLLPRLKMLLRPAHLSSVHADEQLSRGAAIARK